ncbi:MAG: hypothetical protein CMJ81_15225 [Planctomycetaceae bacterium]|nr:hypothetical protein [Planctomycetaceae bacterium]MBP62066.1 hypothetical protein [Planctomycetaceae bacterium]
MLEVSGSEYASREDEKVYIDNTVLDSRKVSQWDRANLERGGECEIQRARENIVQGRFRSSGWTGSWHDDCACRARCLC